MFNTKHKKLLDGLLALGLLCSPGTVWAQHGNVTLTLDNVTVKEALEQLNAQTSYSLWLNVGDVDLSRRVSLQVKNGSVGEVLRTLRELGLEENTLVILTSDNGPWANYGNHAGSSGGLREAKATTFDGGNRVPCIMYWKGKTQPGTTCNKLASNIDLLPTFAEIAHAPLPSRKIDGVSILPLIEGEKDANPRESFVYYYHKNDLEAVTDGMFKLVFPHKYVTYGAYEPGNDGQPGKLANLEIMKPEMYDLRRDPGERYNVISQYPEVAAKLMRIADRKRQELGDDLSRVKGTERREPGLVKGKQRHDL